MFSTKLINTNQILHHFYFTAQRFTQLIYYLNSDKQLRSLTADT